MSGRIRSAPGYPAPPFGPLTLRACAPASLASLARSAQGFVGAHSVSDPPPPRGPDASARAELLAVWVCAGAAVGPVAVRRRGDCARSSSTCASALLASLARSAEGFVGAHSVSDPPPPSERTRRRELDDIVVDPGAGASDGGVDDADAHRDRRRAAARSGRRNRSPDGMPVPLVLKTREATRPRSPPRRGLALRIEPFVARGPIVAYDDDSSPAEGALMKKILVLLDPRGDRCRRGQEGPRGLITSRSCRVRARFGGPGSSSGRVVTRRIATPSAAAVTDAARMPSLASSATLLAPNASSEMNSDTVKPIPPSAATPTSCVNRVPVGQSTRRRARHASHAKPLIPTSLPTTRPTTMPWVTGDDSAASTDVDCSPPHRRSRARTPERSRSCVQGWSRCSSHSTIDTDSRASTTVSCAVSHASTRRRAHRRRPCRGDGTGASGASRPRITPAIVACTPPSWIATHTPVPSTTNGRMLRTPRSRSTDHRDEEAGGGERSGAVEVVGVEERDHHDRADVVDDRQREQEELQRRRDTTAEQAQHADRHRDVGGHRDPPPVGAAPARVERDVHERGHDHPADGRDRRAVRPCA